MKNNTWNGNILTLSMSDDETSSPSATSSALSISSRAALYALIPSLSPSALKTQFNKV